MKQVDKIRPGEKMSDLPDKFNMMADMVNEMYELHMNDGRLREEYPALQKAWDHYQFTKQMVTEKN